MNPFYDENFYYNNFNPQMNPMNQGFPVNRKLKTSNTWKWVTDICRRCI